MSDQPHNTSSQSPGLVAIAAWIVPGGGYLLLKQYGRGLTVGITILLLFFFGLIIGGIRCLEVPGYDAHGHKMFSYYQQEQNKDGQILLVPHSMPDAPPTGPGNFEVGWTFTKHPVDELRSKPWNIPQILIGPLDLICDWWSVRVSKPIDMNNPSAGYIAVRSHSRVNELGVLYTAVAGLLNLLAIIDSSNRAGNTEGQ